MLQCRFHGFTPLSASSSSFQTPYTLSLLIKQGHILNTVLPSSPNPAPPFLLTATSCLFALRLIISPAETSFYAEKTRTRPIITREEKLLGFEFYEATTKLLPTTSTRSKPASISGPLTDITVTIKAVEPPMQDRITTGEQHLQGQSC